MVATGKGILIVGVLITVLAPLHSVSVTYERGDGAMASGPKLQPEEVDVPPGGMVEFETDWKYEKQRFDGTTRYGSHLRKITNNGTHMVIVYLRTSPVSEMHLNLYPGTSQKVKGDLLLLEAAPEPLSAADLNLRCQLIVERADNMNNGAGRPSPSLGKEIFSLRLGEMVAFDSDWKYEKKKSGKGSFYGSHLRRAANGTEGTVIYVRTRGALPAEVGKTVANIARRILQKDFVQEELRAGAPREYKADLLSARCSR